MSILSDNYDLFDDRDLNEAYNKLLERKGKKASEEKALHFAF